MRITVFTSNQRRHCSLISELAKIAESVYAIQEVTTLFPGTVEDFYRKTNVMQEYFSLVQKAEDAIFGDPAFLPHNVTSFPIRMGDLNQIPPAWLHECFCADIFIVFGASYIKGALADALIAKRALNIHIGISPYFRGNSCNFWALNDHRAELVGATIHYLTAGLDTGPILFHAFPKYEGESPFEFTMKSVRAAHRALIDRIIDLLEHKIDAVPQDKTRQIRYARNSDFTDEVAHNFLTRSCTPETLSQEVATRDLSQFIRPYIL